MSGQATVEEMCDSTNPTKRTTASQTNVNLPGRGKKTRPQIHPGRNATPSGIHYSDAARFGRNPPRMKHNDLTLSLLSRGIPSERSTSTPATSSPRCRTATKLVAEAPPLPSEHMQHVVQPPFEGIPEMHPGAACCKIMQATS